MQRKSVRSSILLMSCTWPLVILTAGQVAVALLLESQCKTSTRRECMESPPLQKLGLVVL